MRLLMVKSLSSRPYPLSLYTKGFEARIDDASEAAKNEESGLFLAKEYYASQGAKSLVVLVQVHLNLLAN
jgi:hypothetical protein